MFVPGFKVLVGLPFAITGRFTSEGNIMVLINLLLLAIFFFIGYRYFYGERKAKHKH